MLVVTVVDVDISKWVVGSSPTESSCWALVPQVRSDLPRNREQPGAVFGSLAHEACYFSVHKNVRQPCDFNT